MKVYCIVWCCHLLTVQESRDQSLSSVFFFHAVIIPRLFKKKKAVILTAFQLFNCCLDKPLFCLKDFKLIPHFFQLS